MYNIICIYIHAGEHAPLEATADAFGGKLSQRLSTTLRQFQLRVDQTMLTGASLRFEIGVSTLRFSDGSDIDASFQLLFEDIFGLTSTADRDDDGTDSDDDDVLRGLGAPPAGSRTQYSSSASANDPDDDLDLITAVRGRARARAPADRGRRTARPASERSSANRSLDLDLQQVELPRPRMLKRLSGLLAAPEHFATVGLGTALGVHREAVLAASGYCLAAGRWIRRRVAEYNGNVVRMALDDHLAIGVMLLSLPHLCQHGLFTRTIALKNGLPSISSLRRLLRGAGVALAGVSRRFHNMGPVFAQLSGASGKRVHAAGWESALRLGRHLAAHGGTFDPATLLNDGDYFGGTDIQADYHVLSSSSADISILITVTS